MDDTIKFILVFPIIIVSFTVMAFANFSPDSQMIKTNKAVDMFKNKQIDCYELMDRIDVNHPTFEKFALVLRAYQTHPQFYIVQWECVKPIYNVRNPTLENVMPFINSMSCEEAKNYIEKLGPGIDDIIRIKGSTCPDIELRST